MKLFQKNDLELGLQIAWLDKQKDAELFITQDGVYLEIWRDMNGVSVRLCEGVGTTLLSAIYDARKILREQGATD